METGVSPYGNESFSGGGQVIGKEQILLTK